MFILFLVKENLLSLSPLLFLISIKSSACFRSWPYFSSWPTWSLRNLDRTSVSLSQNNWFQMVKLDHLRTIVVDIFVNGFDEFLCLLLLLVSSCCSPLPSQFWADEILGLVVLGSLRSQCIFWSILLSVVEEHGISLLFFSVKFQRKIWESINVV